MGLPTMISMFKDKRIMTNDPIVEYTLWRNKIAQPSMGVQSAPVPFDFAEWHGNLMMLADTYWEASSAARFRHREQLRQHALNVGQHWKARAMLSAAPVPVPLTEYWCVLYLHDWDADGKVYPEVHSLHASWQEAEKERATRMSPEKYWVRRARAHGIAASPEQKP